MKDNEKAYGASYRYKKIKKKRLQVPAWFLSLKL